MEILLVDDDLHVIQGINKNINWERLGIHQVHSAFSVKEAKEILCSNEIDILICDIEMPQENGIQLLEWVREIDYQVQAVFLTCFADFHYAQQAIKLDSIEYLLKPVDYTMLESCIRKAADNVQKKKEASSRIESGRHWEQNKRKVKKIFWEKMILGNVPDKEPEQYIAEYGLDYEEDEQFLLCLFLLPRAEKEFFRTINAEELLKTCDFPNEEMEIEAIWAGDYPEILCVLKENQAMTEKRAEFESAFWNFAVIHKAVGVVGAAGNFIEISRMIVKMREQVKQISIMIPMVIWQNENNQKAGDYQNRELEKWRELLLRGDYQLFCNHIKVWLKNCEREKRVCIRNLELLRADITQTVYTVLSSWNICAHQLFQSEKQFYYDQAVYSVEGMLEYVEWLVEKSREYKNFLQKPKGIAFKVKEYLDEHYQEEISREDYSKIVYLNPDYISRQFKKEIGKSISGYILEKRMNKAKELLVFSNDPIGVVSIQAGYDNFAYFSKVFKDYTGLSPNEYRKEKKKEQR